MNTQYLAVCADGIHVRNTAKYAARLPGVLAVHEVEIDHQGGLSVLTPQELALELTPAEIACLLRGYRPK